MIAKNPRQDFDQPGCQDGLWLTLTDETRISELLWRTIKLRASLLALATVVSLIVWSAVLSGDQRANLVDAEYCQKLVALGDSSIAPIRAKPSQAVPMVDVT